MRFIVTSSALLKHLQQISGVTNASTVLPILEDFLFVVEKNKLTVMASDLESFMKIEMDVDATEPGKICIPAKILLDTLKNIPDQPLTISIEENYSIEITSNNGRYKVLGENPDNFPKEPDHSGSDSFTIPSRILLRAINKTLFAVSNDDLRPAMNGVYMEMEDEGLLFVATDAHKLVRYKRTDVGTQSTNSVILPKKPLNILKSILPDTQEEITAGFNDKHFFIELKNIRMSFRLIDARFPDYRVVIPKDNPYKLRVDKSSFQSALRRVSIYSNKTTNQVVLTITGSELQLHAQDVDFSYESSERMPCQYDGEDLTIAFNAKSLIDMLNVTETEEVIMELSTPSRAGIIKPSENEPDEDVLMLLMPLMINQ